MEFPKLSKRLHIFFLQTMVLETRFVVSKHYKNILWTSSISSNIFFFFFFASKQILSSDFTPCCPPQLSNYSNKLMAWFQFQVIMSKCHDKWIKMDYRALS
jgi:hypothetical protein